MKIAVIGGGASGLAAAITAARCGAEVLLLEKEERVGRKILATGNGKCNYSNELCNSMKYNSSDPTFVETVLKTVTPGETLAFFKEIGIWPRVESEGRIYPSSQQASSVLDALRMEIAHLGVKVLYQQWIKEIIVKLDDKFQVISQQDQHLLQADKVIIACGGKAGSQYGCMGDGYDMAKALGHKVMEPKPALVQLTAAEDFFRQLKGVRSKGSVCLICGTEPVKQEQGEIQFTEHGLSGICIFDLSSLAVRKIAEGQPCYIAIDLFPQVESEVFHQMMRERLALSQYKSAEEFLNGLIHKKLITVILKLCGVEKVTMPASEISQTQCNAIAEMLKRWVIQITGTRSWDEAQTTSGGVFLSEIQPQSMESKIRKGLYFCGEVVDVDGQCGGYNLQWAWSTGILAGRSAAGWTEQKKRGSKC